MVRKWVYIVGACIGAVVLLILLLPLFINANSYKPQIEALLQQSTNRMVTVGNIRLSIFSGGVITQDVSVSDDSAFSKGNFLSAKSVRVGVRLLPLIFSREWEVTGIIIDQPQIALIRSASGTWNFSSIGPARPSGASASGSASSWAGDISVQHLVIRDGTLSIMESGPGARRREYDKADLEASNFSYTSQFPFQFSVQTPGSGTIKLSGKAGPLNQADLQQTPLDAALDVRNFDLAATGFVAPSSGVGGNLDFNGDLNDDGKLVNSKGTATASKLHLVPGSAPVGQPIQLDYDADYQMASQNGKLNQCEVHVGNALAYLSGTFNDSRETPSVQLKLTGSNMPVSDLESVLPAVAVTLPSGASLQDGSMNVNLAIAGPIDHLVISGPASISNTRLTNYDLGSKLGALGPFSGVKKGSDTVIQTFSSDLRVADGIRADKINMVVDGIGSMTGSGTVSADRTLDFKMEAHLTGGGAMGALGGLSEIVNGGSSGKGGIPFLIRGTTSDPVFLPDVAGMAGGLGEGIAGAGEGASADIQNNVGKAFGGLFGKEKK